MLVFQKEMQLTDAPALAGSINFKKESISARSTNKSGVQRNPHGLLWKLREIAVILQFFLSNRTRESLALNSSDELQASFL
jgi:hypothetical protein